MDKQSAMDMVKAVHPNINAGIWSVEENGQDWCVTHRYAGRRKVTVEAYVTPGGAIETVDGHPYQR